jgi:hypothetical protein
VDGSGSRLPYTQCFIGKLLPDYWRRFISKIVGAHTNHASDQKLLVRLFIEWKRLIERELRGEQALLASKSPLEILQIVSSHLSQGCGQSPIDWNAISEEEQVRRISEAWRSICLPFGEEAYRQLSIDEQHKIDLFVWGGCCMHKSHNSTQAGYEAMTKAWSRIKDAAPPVRLITKDNRAAADKGTEEQKARINLLAKGGAIAHNSIMAMVMHNKDDKKGQQDVFNAAYERHFGSRKSFPEVQTARFGSNLQCSVEKVVNRDFYIQFMCDLGNSKAKLTPNKSMFTNLEQNVNAGLHCISTLTEDAAAAVYHEVIDGPYLGDSRRLDANGKPQNLLDKGETHERLLKFIKRIADDPGSALAVDHDAGLPLDFLGQPISRPDVYDAVKQLTPQLPHLKTMIQAFFAGAYAKWQNFVTEFAEDGIIAKMTPEERAAVFLSTTNDINEGALGMLRVALRKSPNLSLQGYNARMLLRKNNLVAYMKEMPASAWTFCQVKARSQKRGGVEKKRRIRMADLRVVRATTNAAARVEKAKKLAEQQAKIDEIMAGVSVVCDESRIAAMKGEDLKLQIQWYRRFDERDAATGERLIQVPPFSKLKVDERRDLVRALALKYSALKAASIGAEDVIGTCDAESKDSNHYEHLDELEEDGDWYETDCEDDY